MSGTDKPDRVCVILTCDHRDIPYALVEVIDSIWATRSEKIRKQLNGIPKAYEKALDNRCNNRCKADLKCSRENISAMPFTDMVALLVRIFSPEGIGKMLLEHLGLDRTQIDIMAESIVQGTLEIGKMQRIYREMTNDYGRLVMPITQIYIMIVTKYLDYDLYREFWPMGYDMLVFISGTAYVLSEGRKYNDLREGLGTCTFWKIGTIIEENEHNVESLPETIRKRVKYELLKLHHEMPPKPVVTCAQSRNVKLSTQSMKSNFSRFLRSWRLLNAAA